MVKKQLSIMLPEGVHVSVSQHKPTMSEEAGQLAEGYLQAHRTTPGSGKDSLHSRTVEEVPVEGILLDTDATITLVQKNLVPV